MQSKKVSTMVKIALLSAIAFILMFLETPLPLMPPFLKIEFSDLPAIVGALALGPMAGVVVELIKNVLHFVVRSSTGGVGEIANFIIGVSFVLPLSILYRAELSGKRYLLGAVFATFSMVTIGCLVNYFMLIPFYARLFAGGDINVIVGMAQNINPLIADYKALILLGIAPFNLIKSIMLSVLGFLVIRSSLKRLLYQVQ